MKNDENTRLAIISGRHGLNKKTELPSVHALDYTLYEEDCVAFGFTALSDSCEYEECKNHCPADCKCHMPSSVCVERVLQNTESRPAMQTSMLPGMPHNLDKMNIAVLNVANYHESVRGPDGANGIDQLVSELERLKPTHLVIAWCWSSNCDLAMALRVRGVFSQMLVNHDLRQISGNPMAKLSQGQAQILKDAQNKSIKHFILTGNKGSGKTILAAEIAKIKIAQLECQSQKRPKKSKLLIRLHCHMTKYSSVTRSSELAYAYTNKHFSGYDLNEGAVQNIALSGGCKFVQEVTRNGLLKWIMDTLSDEHTVLIIDDMPILLHGHGHDLTSWTMDLGSIQGCLIWTSSQAGNYEYLEENYGWFVGKLKRSYRYTAEIAEFLHHHGKFWEESVTLFRDDLKSYPQPLPQFEHPVIWLVVEDRDQHKETDVLQCMMAVLKKQLGKELRGGILGITPELLVFDSNGELSISDGSEADVIIMYPSRYFIEEFSRARRQLFIITRSEGDHLYEAKKSELKSYFKSRYFSDERVKYFLDQADLHCRLNAAWATESDFRTSRVENKRVMKVGVFSSELFNGRWWDKVKSQPPRKDKIRQ